MTLELIFSEGGFDDEVRGIELVELYGNVSFFNNTFEVILVLKCFS